MRRTFSVHEYVGSLKNAADLVDRLSNPQDSSVRLIGFVIHVMKLVIFFHNMSKNLLQDTTSYLSPSLQSFRSNKPVYPEHIPLSDIQKGLKLGRFHQGSFQTSRDNYLEALVSASDLEERVRRLAIRVTVSLNNIIQMKFWIFLV